MASPLRKQTIQDLTALLKERSSALDDILDSALGANTEMRRTTERVLRQIEAAEHAPNQERALARAFDKLIAATADLQVGPPNDSRPWTDTYRSLRDLLAVRVLYAYGYRHPANHVTVRLLTRARKAQFTIIELQCLFHLRTQAALQGNLTLVHSITAEVNALQHIYALELEVEGWEDIATGLVATRKIWEPVSLRQIESFGRKAEALRHNYDRWVFHATAFRLRSRVMQVRQDWLGALAVCDEAVEYYRRNPHFSSPSRLGEFAIRGIACCSDLNDLAGARKRVDQLRPYLAQNRGSWLTVLELVWKLCMRTADLTLAAAICNEARAYYKKAFSQQKRDQWRLREVALYIYSDYFKGQSGGVEQALGPRRFYLSNIERSMPALTADKTDSNVVLTICKYLQFVSTKRYSDVESMRDGLSLYIKRHLTPAGMPRTTTFFRMLIRIPSNDFNADRCERVCAHFQEHLEHELPVGQESAELIPYHLLWPAVLDMLRANAEDDRRRR